MEPVTVSNMGIGGRISRGFRLVRMSWGVVKAEKGLLLLPLISLACSLAIIVGITGIAYETGVFGDFDENGPPAIAYVLSFLAYVVLYAIGIYFNAVVIGVATIRLKGGDPTLRDGFRLANSKLGKIVGWALLGATVGLVLQWLDERAGIVGRIVIWIVGFVWNLATFMVVPVLLYESVGVGGSVKRSWGIVKERWGEQIVGNSAIGIAMFIVLIPVFILCVVIGNAILWLGIALWLLAVLVAVGVGSVLSGVFTAALYQFATTGRAEGGFSQADLDAAFRASRKRKFLGW